MSEDLVSASYQYEVFLHINSKTQNTGIWNNTQVPEFDITVANNTENLEDGFKIIGTNDSPWTKHKKAKTEKRGSNNERK